MHEPLVKMLCHKGALAALCVDRGGRYMATSGIDGQLKLWDVRTYRPLHSHVGWWKGLVRRHRPTSTPQRAASVAWMRLAASGARPTPRQS